MALTPTGPTPSPTNLTTGIRLDPLDGARFPPGRLFASRYRIVTLLGRGAMGEVYRADDLRLGQPVALKLMSDAMARRADGLARLTSEVRLARGIAHPNVCRVYDIGHAEGWHYLSMEFVDGETLDSLLRRIGQPPMPKALEMARQLCAGLAAAHERGVLHRDLKPANIMVDGRGQIRILDFGLAVAAADAVGEVAGTPAYMAPEQRAGEPATTQSDLFSLGRVLSELLPPADSRATRLIEQCLQQNPATRPSSARSALAALPSGPVQAADDNVIPTAAMVAASPDSGALAPLHAWALLAAAIVGCLAVASRASILNVAPSDLPKPPEVLAERAREALAAQGGQGGEVDRAFWWWADATTQQARFTYRHSSTWLVPRNILGIVTDSDPPLEAGATGLITLDANGQPVDERPPPRGTFSSGRSPTGETALWLFILFGFVAGGILARRNLRAGEGDLTGAWRLAVFVGTAGVAASILRAHHVPSPADELASLLTMTALAWAWAAFSWLAYISFEPYVRRWWPHTLVTWSRLLRGRVRDPLIGRDLLLGTVSAAISTALLLAVVRAEATGPPAMFRQPALDALQSPWSFASILVRSALLAGLHYSFATIAALVVCRFILRRTWLASAALVLAGLPVAIEVPSAIDITSSAAVMIFSLAILLRVGVLAHVVMLIVGGALTTLPLTLDPAAWYFGRSLVVLVLLGAVAIYGFLVALGSRPAFGDLTKVPASPS